MDYKDLSNLKAMDFKVVASIFIKDHTVPMGLKTVQDYQNITMSDHGPQLKPGLLYILYKDYQILQDLSQINNNTEYCCGIEKWDKVTVTYKYSDYDKLMDMTRPSIIQTKQPLSPKVQKAKLDPVIRENERLKKIQKIKDNQLNELKKKVKLDWMTKRQMLIEEN